MTYNALRDADDTDYGRFRDTEGDRQWQWSQNYNAYRDKVGDEQWLYSQNYQKYQDALSQYQWALDYNNALYAQNAAAKGRGGGGGRRSGGGGGGGYSSAGGSSGGADLEAVFNKAKASTKSSGTPYGPYLNFGQRIANASKKVGKAAKKATKKK